MGSVDKHREEGDVMDGPGLRLQVPGPRHLDITLFTSHYSQEQKPPFGLHGLWVNGSLTLLLLSGVCFPLLLSVRA